MGYILDFHKVMAAEDFGFLKAYNELREAVYTKQEVLEALRDVLPAASVPDFMVGFEA